MTDQQQPFSPPLTAEERNLFDWAFLARANGSPTAYSEHVARFASDFIHERRRRFGVAESPVKNTLLADAGVPSMTTLFGENQTLRAEVERLTKERDELRRSSRIDASEVDDLLDERNAERARAEKAEADATSLRQSLHASEALRETHKADIERLTKERDEARDHYRDVVTKLEQCSDSLGPINRERASMRARAEKAEAELAKVTAREKEGVELMDKIIAGLRAELAAARPVLEAVVRWFSERAWTVKDSDTLRDYAMSQRAARAAKAQDATNNVDGGN